VQAEVIPCAKKTISKMTVPAGRFAQNLFSVVMFVHTLFS
jgi:hypothetical protein